MMHGPDGKNYPNHSIFEEVVPGRRIFFEHQPPHHFHMRISLEKQGGGTLVEWRMVFDSPEACAASKPVVVPSNEENFDRLEAELERAKADAFRVETRSWEIGGFGHGDGLRPGLWARGGGVFLG